MFVTRLIAPWLVMMALAVGCQPWTFVKQAVPNSLVGQELFVLAPIQFEDMNVTEKQRTLLERGFSYGMRSEGREEFVIKTHDEVASEGVLVQVTFRLLPGGTKEEVERGDAQVLIQVAFSQGGQELDVIEQTEEMGVSGSWTQGGPNSGASLGYLSDEQQLSRRGEALGVQVAEYLKKRTK